MEDLSSDMKKQDSTIEFIAVKEEKFEDTSDEDFQGVKEVYNKGIDEENAVFIKAEDEANRISECTMSEEVSEEIKSPGEEGVKNDLDFCVYKDDDPLLLPRQDVAGNCRKLCPLDGDQTIHKEDKEVTHKNKNEEAKVNYFSCEVCGRKYRCKSRLVAHIRVHTKEKPFSCKVCNKSFLRKDYVVEHMKVHSSEKLYACEVCNKDFSRKGHLVKHIKEVHMKEKPYPCISDMKKQDSTIEFIAVKEEKFEDTSEEDFQGVKEEYNKDIDEENTVFIKAEDEANRISECTMSEEVRNPGKEGDKNEDNSEEDFQGMEEYNKDLDEENTVFIKAEDEANMIYECTTSEEIKSPGKGVKDEYNSEEDFQGVKEDYKKDIYKENTVFIKAEIEANMISEEIKSPGEEGVKNDSDFCVYKDEDPLLLPTQDVAGDCRKLCPLDGDQTIHKEDKEVKHKNKSEEAKVKYFSCEVCGRKYRCKSRLVAHIRVHTKEKPFSCKVCNKSFLRKDYVVEHMKVHSSEKPYACEVCNKDFSRKGHLVKHIKGVHMKEKPYLCEICSKVFSVKSDLSVHMRVHTNEKPYSCKLCSKVFTVRSNLVRHMRSHNKEKPYSCEVCSKSFFRKDYLVEHMRVHTNEKPFTCELCNKSFSEKGNLVRHMRVHTGEIS